jgi:hypothetical protein
MYVDNSFWTLLAKTGLVGLVAIVLLVMPLLRSGVLYIRRSDSTLDIALGASVVCLALLGQFPSIRHMEGAMTWLGAAWAIMRARGANAGMARGIKAQVAAP